MKVTLNKFIVCSNCLHFYVKSIDCFRILPTSPTDQELRLYFIFYYFVIGSRLEQVDLPVFQCTYIRTHFFFVLRKNFECLSKHTSYEFSFMLLLRMVSPPLHLPMPSTPFQAHSLLLSVYISLLQTLQTRNQIACGLPDCLPSFSNIHLFSQFYTTLK